MNPVPSQMERLAAEIIQTWLAGTRPDAAKALADRPELAADKTLALDLAFAEFCIRESRGEPLDPEEFCARFPTIHASLGRMLAQRAVSDAAGGAADPPVSQTLNVPIVPVRPIDAGNRESNLGMPESAASGLNDPASSEVWPGSGSRVGDYNLLRQLGKGAFGRVFLAHEEPTGRPVVIKLSRQRCDEARVLGRLVHRNVISVLSAPQDASSGFYLMVMPYVGSATLEDLLELAYPVRGAEVKPPRRADVILHAARRNLRPGDPVPAEIKPEPFLLRASFVDGVIWLGIRIAEGLSAVHRCGFVHHDLKPSNVLLSLDGQPQLLDFNLASDIRNAKSRLGGTLPYMPPEHLEAVQEAKASPLMDARGDVYSLGLILYELLTGVHPFGRIPKARSLRSVAAAMLVRQRTGVKPIRELNRDVPVRLWRLIRDCLAYNPGNRPQTAAAMAAELRHCFSTRQRAGEFLASRPGRVAVTTAAIGFVSTVTWWAGARAAPLPPAEEVAAVDHLRRGEASFSEGQYAAAIPDLLLATQHNPDDAALWLTLGRARLTQMEWVSARADLEKAAALRPTDGPTLATLAWCQARLGYHELALTNLARAEAHGYRPAGLYALKSFVYSSLDRNAEAEVALSRALQLEPMHRPALVMKAQVALVRSMDDRRLPPAAAMTAVEQALAAGPADGYLSLWAARFYAWLACPPPNARGPWYHDQPAARQRCLHLLREAVERGVPLTFVLRDSGFANLRHDLEQVYRDWQTAALEAPANEFWRLGNPMIEFR